VLLAILLQSPIAISCLKNRNTVGESPTNIRKVLRWESVISIGGGLQESRRPMEIFGHGRDLFCSLFCHVVCERELTER
jgi:hypothetical protein